MAERHRGSHGLLVLILHFATGVVGRRLLILYAFFTLGMVAFSNFFVPCLWLCGQHHTAQYIMVQEADELLREDESVLVLELGGKARAYPRDWMMVPLSRAAR